MHNKWFVITGGPSVGKTTLLNELERLGYATLPEAARTVIDEGIADGLTIDEIRADEFAFQDAVLQRKILIEHQLSPKQLTILDRGMHDSLAYLRSQHGTPNQTLLNACANSTYQKVFLLEPLDTYTIDYARTESPELAAQLTELLYAAYQEYGLTPIRIPAVSVQERVNLILQHIPEPPTLLK